MVDPTVTDVTVNYFTDKSYFILSKQHAQMFT